MPGGVVWTPQEDDRLKLLVQEYGDKRWSLIATKLGSKESKQCRRRWKNCLSLDVKKGSWSPEEDNILREAHAVHGNRWTLIAKLVGGRTDNAVKNRWAALLRRKSVSRRKARSSCQGKLRGVSKDYGLSGPGQRKRRAPRKGVLAQAQQANMVMNVTRDTTSDPLAFDPLSSNTQVPVGAPTAVIISEGNRENCGPYGVSGVGELDDDILGDLLTPPNLPSTDGLSNPLSFPQGDNGPADFAGCQTTVGTQVTTPMDLAGGVGLHMTSAAMAWNDHVGECDALAQCPTGSHAYTPVDVISSGLANASRMKTLDLPSNVAIHDYANDQAFKADVQLPCFTHTELDMLITALQFD